MILSFCQKTYDMINKTSILNLLKKNQKKHLNCINFLNNCNLISIAQVNESVLIKGTSDRTWNYIALDNFNDIDEMFKLINDNDKFFFVNGDATAEYLRGKLNLEVEIKACRYILDEYKLQDLVYTYLITTMNENDADLVYNNSDYKKHIDKEYVADRISSGPSCIIKINNEPAGWCLTHDDGSIGMLHVLVEFRKKGIALQLVKYITEEIIKLNEVPYAHILEHNFNSIKLFEKAGYKYIDNVFWLRRD